jgi:hypothetical protein
MPRVAFVVSGCHLLWHQSYDCLHSQTDEPLHVNTVWIALPDAFYPYNVQSNYNR